MKAMWDRLKPVEIVNKWRNVITSFRNVHEERPLNTGHFFRILSDTIIITIPCELNQSTIIRTFDLLGQPFIESIKTRMLLRGIVSYGPYYLSQQLIIGPAVNDAVSNHAKWHRDISRCNPLLSIPGIYCSICSTETIHGQLMSINYRLFC